MEPRYLWTVRKWRNYGLATTVTAWEVFNPDGGYEGSFPSWSAAMRAAMQWAGIAAELEDWLEHLAP